MTSDFSDPKIANSGERFRWIVEGSEDAIVSKDLDGVIVTWNAGAERLFGYNASEAIGQHIGIIVPDDRLAEEAAILERIRGGQPVRHFETVRNRKDGTLVDLSLTVSPVRNAAGKLIGASKIAREITERRRAEEQQELLLREMDHRVKNAFALAGSLLALSARKATTPAELAATAGERLLALARAHSLTLPTIAGDAERSTTLHALIKTILSPYEGTGVGEARLAISGPDLVLAGRAVTSFALLLHELATNAAKYGALSSPDGQVEVECSERIAQMKS